MPPSLLGSVLPPPASLPRPQLPGLDVASPSPFGADCFAAPLNGTACPLFDSLPSPVLVAIGA